MKEILKTTLLEYEKSTFLIDLVKHDTDKLYISILQTIQQKSKEPIQQELKINPAVIEDIFKVIREYQTEIPKAKIPQKNLMPDLKQEEIQNRYLKGISIESLAMQFDCKKELVEQILNNRGIEIVSNEPPKPERKFRRAKTRGKWSKK